MDKKTFRVWSTRKNYWKGQNGKCYYGDLEKNGYVTETLEEQEKQRIKMELEQKEKNRRDEQMRQREIVHAQNAADIGAAAGSGLGTIALVAFLLAGVLVAVYLTLVYCLVLSIAVLWPDYIQKLIWNYKCIIYDFGIAPLLVALLRTLHLAGTICLFVYCFRAISPERAVTKRYFFFAKVSLAFSTVMLTLIDLANGGRFSLDSILESLFMSLGYALLPTLILYYREYRVSGQKHFIRHMAQLICGKVPGHGLTFKILGVMTVLFTVIAALSSGLVAGIIFGIVTVATFYIAFIGET